MRSWLPICSRIVCAPELRGCTLQSLTSPKPEGLACQGDLHMLQLEHSFGLLGRWTVHHDLRKAGGAPLVTLSTRLVC